MSLSHRLPAVLFWTLTVIALAGLTPCLVLPAWIDYQHAVRLRAVRRSNVARLAAEVAAQEKQISHLHNDEAYKERVLHDEVGLDPPGIEAILIDRERPDELVRATLPRSRDLADIDDDAFPTLTMIATTALNRYPSWTNVFILDETRPLVMGMSGTLLICAILLLGKRPRSERSGESGDAAQPPASRHGA